MPGRDASARLVLEHLPARLAVLAELDAALRPGGWLVIEDVDMTAMTGLPVASQFVTPRRLASTLRRVGRASIAMAGPRGGDYDAFGRELPRPSSTLAR